MPTPARREGFREPTEGERGEGREEGEEAWRPDPQGFEDEDPELKLPFNIQIQNFLNKSMVTLGKGTGVFNTIATNRDNKSSFFRPFRNDAGMRTASLISTPLAAAALFVEHAFIAVVMAFKAVGDLFRSDFDTAQDSSAMFGICLGRMVVSAFMFFVGSIVNAVDLIGACCTSASRRAPQESPLKPVRGEREFLDEGPVPRYGQFQ